MGKPYSDDLRERVVAAIEAGHTRVKVAELYNMALSLARAGQCGEQLIKNSATGFGAMAHRHAERWRPVAQVGTDHPRLMLDSHSLVVSRAQIPGGLTHAIGRVDCPNAGDRRVDR